MTVYLTYFKDTGKYYGEGIFAVDKGLPLFRIWERVGALWAAKALPGLGSGSWDGPILIDVPDHPHRHPHLFLPKAR